MAFTLKDNTVKAEGQMLSSSTISYLGDSTAKTRVLILGNSITRHGYKEDIGWTWDYGMAASKKANDYVHRLLKMSILDEKDVFYMVCQTADYEIKYDTLLIEEFFKECKDFCPDVIICRIGENVANNKTDPTRTLWETKLNDALNFIKTPTTKFIFTTCFWAFPALDETVYPNLAKAFSAPLIDLTIAGDERMMAKGLFWHDGVAGHPGDEGMRVIAERIYGELKKLI